VFLVLERRREFAVLEAVGADKRQIVAAPAVEGMVAVGGSIVIGVPLGLCLGALAVRVLGLFFTLPPPLLSVPVWTLLGLVGLMAATSAVAMGVSLATAVRKSPVEALRVQ
jgi:putative ABC transport system permease protein